MAVLNEQTSSLQVREKVLGQSVCVLVVGQENKDLACWIFFEPERDGVLRMRSLEHLHDQAFCRWEALGSKRHLFALNDQLLVDMVQHQRAATHWMDHQHLRADVFQGMALETMLHLGKVYRKQWRFHQVRENLVGSIVVFLRTPHQHFRAGDESVSCEGQTLGMVVMPVCEKHPHLEHPFPQQLITQGFVATAGVYHQGYARRQTL